MATPASGNKSTAQYTHQPMDRQVSSVTISPPGAIERITVGTATVAVGIGANEIVGPIVAAAIAETAREVVIEPATRAALSERTVLYTDGSKSVASFSGSREYDSQGRVTETTDRFGGSTKVTYDEKGSEDVTVYDTDYVSTVHIDRRKNQREQAEERYAKEEGEESVDLNRKKGESLAAWAERRSAAEEREEVEWNNAKKEREKNEAKKEREETVGLDRRKGESMEAWCERRYAAEEAEKSFAAERVAVNKGVHNDSGESSAPTANNSSCIQS